MTKNVLSTKNSAVENKKTDNVKILRFEGKHIISSDYNKSMSDILLIQR